MTGPLTLLLWGMLHPVVVPWVDLGHFSVLERVAFRPIWTTEDLPVASHWLVAEAVLALTIGAWAAFFWPLSTDRRSL